eukprot:gene5247-8858_t
MGNSSSISFEQKDLIFPNSGTIKSVRGYTSVVNHLKPSVLLFGGFPATDNNVYSADLKTNKWTKVATNGTPPTGRFGHTGVIHHEGTDKVCFKFNMVIDWYIFGGEDQYTKRLNDLVCFNLTDFTWNTPEVFGTPPSPRSNHSAVWHDNKMIICGGERQKDEFLGEMYIFDFYTMTWSDLVVKSSLLTSIPKRASHSAKMYGDMMIMFGGKSSNGLCNDTHMVDIKKKSIVRLKTRNDPQKRNRSQMIIRGGFILTFGGFSGKDRKPQNDLYIMRLDNLKWIKMGLEECVKRDYVYSTLFHQGRLLLLGGEDNQNGPSQILSTNLDEYTKTMDIPFNELKFEERIYNDMYVDVYKGTWRKQKVAITMIKQDQNEIIDQIISQINVHRKIKHPNIVDFKCFVSEDPKYCLVTSYFHPITISDSIHEKKLQLTFKQKKKFSIEICKAVRYLHSNKLLHRALSTTKILLKEDHIKFSDYFLRIEPYLKKSKKMIEIFKEPYFMAPEVLKGNQFSEKSDIFSLGSIFWELFSGEKISKLDINDLNSIADSVMKGKRPCNESRLKNLIQSNSDDKEIQMYLDLILQCWNQNPEERPSLDYVIDALRSNSSSFTTNTKIENINNSIIERDQENDIQSNYLIQKKIGQGGQATVFLVKEKSTMKQYALKRFLQTPLSGVNKTLQEMRSYVGISHSSIVTVHDFYLSTENCDPSNCQLNIVMDYCDSGDLERKIKKKQTKKELFEQHQIHSLFLQTVQGMSYIHEKHLIHRDLKPGNLFLHNEDVVKIGDLGLAKNMDEDTTETHVGTIAYMSPEQRSQMPYTYSADVWSLGMILFELLTLKRMDFGKLMKNRNYLNDIFADVSDNYDSTYFEMVKMCLTINPDQRPTAKTLLEMLTGFSEGKFPSLTSQISFMKKSNDSVPEVPMSFVETETIGSQDEKIENENVEILLLNKKSFNDVESWSLERVGVWLDEIGLGTYKKSFFEHEVNGEALLELKETDEIDKYLGVKKLGHIKILQKRIRTLRNK